MTIARPLGFQVIALPPVQEPKPGLLRRLLDALLESREVHAQKAVDDYVARQGSRLTDSLEREIGERLLDGGMKFDR